MNKLGISIEGFLKKQNASLKNISDSKIFEKIKNTNDFLRDRVDSYKWFTESSPFIDQDYQMLFEKIR